MSQPRDDTILNKRKEMPTFDVEDLKLQNKNGPYAVQGRQLCKSYDAASIIGMLPIFGGTQPDEPKKDEPVETKVVKTETVTKPAGTETNPLEDLQKDPKKLQDLLDQLTNTQKTLETVTKEHGELKSEKEKEARAKMSQQEQLQTDLDNAQEIIQKQDRVIRHTALTNAILEMSDYSWHSVRQMMAELKDGNYNIDVDLEGGKATVTGIDKEVKRISEACPWLLKSTANNGAPPVVGRPSGSPPAAPRTGVTKPERRNNLIGRFSGIAPG